MAVVAMIKITRTDEVTVATMTVLFCNGEGCMLEAATLVLEAAELEVVINPDLLVGFTETVSVGAIIHIVS